MKQNRRILQEVYKYSPWRMLICCIALNQSSGLQVKPIVKKLFDKYPTPLAMIGANREEMADILKPTGLQNVKAERIQNFVNDYFNKKWKRPIELRGIGQYGQDSWDIFIKKNHKIKPTDKVLISYLERRKELGKKLLKRKKSNLFKVALFILFNIF